MPSLCNSLTYKHSSCKRLFQRQAQIVVASCGDGIHAGGQPHSQATTALTSISSAHADIVACLVAACHFGSIALVELLLRHVGDVACLADLWGGRTCLMEAALWYHTDVVGMLLSKRAGTQHDLDWQSYEGVVTYWLLAYGKAHHRWTSEIN